MPARTSAKANDAGADWYVALLRGINVGGNNIIPMADLRACVTDLGARDVATYIQSGNVLFDGRGRPHPEWVVRIERGLADRFGYDARIVLRDLPELQAVVRDAPLGFGEAPDTHRYDVVFLKEPLSAAEALSQIQTREGVDFAAAGETVLYFSRLIARATQSRLSKVANLPIYRQMTIRNWRTTTTLLAMLEERAGT